MNANIGNVEAVIQFSVLHLSALVPALRAQLIVYRSACFETPSACEKKKKKPSKKQRLIPNLAISQYLCGKLNCI